MQYKITVGFLPGVLDSEANTVLKTLKKLGYDQIQKVKTATSYIINIDLSDKNQIETIAKKTIVNPVINEYQIHAVDEKQDFGNYSVVEIKGKLSDPLGNSTSSVFADLGYKAKSVKTSKIYLLKGEALNKELLEKIAKELLSNPITEEYRIL
ncbi:MAG: phosphoribosylformylglycinamidine synthase, purS protein [Candidatus Nanohalarchaeota archaeon]|nr:MAG: phosphoribosylformylglycinamidine synthase, purS protein [Candidatus Nanohaloarchaeota archaeon]